MAQDRLARVIPSMHVHLCVALWLISLHPSPVFYFVPPFSFQPFQMFTSEFNERFRSNPLCDFRLGTVATSDHETPLTLSAEYHFFSDPGPRNDQRPAGKSFCKKRHKCSVSNKFKSVSHQMMSLNIDMKIIRPLNCDGSPILFMHLWTSWTSCNVVNPGKIFHLNSIGSPSIVSKVLYCGESVNQSNCCAQAVFDVGFCFIFPRHNSESENT